MPRHQVSLWNNYPILGPFGVAVTGLTTVSQQIVAPDTGRRGILFHNPGAQNKRVLPVGGGTLVGGAGGILIYPQSEFVIFQTEDTQFNVNCGWIAVTDDGTLADGSLTVFDFTANTPGAPIVPSTMRMAQQVPSSSPVGSQVLGIGTGGVSALIADINRHGVEFHNPSAVQVAVCPSNLAPSIGAGSMIILPGATKRIIGNNLVRVNSAWSAVAQSAGGALTSLGLYG